MYRTSYNYYKTKKQGGYASKFEADYGQELALRKKAKDIKDYKEQVTLDLVVNGYLVCTYRIDFVIYHNSGEVEYVETKGVPTAAWSIKWKLFEALYSNKPNTKLTIVFQGHGRRPPKARKISRAKKDGAEQ